MMARSRARALPLTGLAGGCMSPYRRSAFQECSSGGGRHHLRQTEVRLSRRRRIGGHVGPVQALADTVERRAADHCARSTSDNSTLS
jgi:hypothetical protein